MAKFPKKEADIIALAEQMIAGLSANPAVFPNPPHPAYQPNNGIMWKVNQYNSNRQDLIAAHAAAEQATADKDAAFENLIDAMKTDIRYAETAVNFDDTQLKLIGWSAKKSPTALTPPGQTLSLEVSTQGEASLTLSWQAPIDGGKVIAYRVVRRIEEGADEDVATAVKPEASLTDQPQRQKLAFKVIAINKAGEGSPSNTVEVVL
jgi:hypothetical protein